MVFSIVFEYIVSGNIKAINAARIIKVYSEYPIARDVRIKAVVILIILRILYFLFCFRNSLFISFPLLFQLLIMRYADAPIPHKNPITNKTIMNVASGMIVLWRIFPTPWSGSVGPNAIKSFASPPPNSFV